MTPIKRFYTVPKNLNPPNAPQIRPIEMYWGALKQKVYAKNWSAKNRDQLTDQKNQEMCKRNGFSNLCANV